MKCILLLLAFELVLSDKLDRTYLPPPGAKYSGGTLDDLHPPLEYPKETEPGTVQNGLLPNFIPGTAGSYTNQDVKNRFPSAPLDYASSPKYDGYFKPTPISNDFRDTSSQPGFGLNTYNNFPSTFPSTSYLPSKPMSGAKSYNISASYPFYATTSPKNEVIPGTSKLRPGFDQNFTKNYYFVPATQTNRNGIVISKPDNIKSEIAAMTQYPNQNSKNVNNIADNYQPSAFGFYGGNPMIMTSQNQVPQNLKDNTMMSIQSHDSKFGDIRKTSTAKPYQTSLVDSTSIFESDTNISNPSVSTAEQTMQNKKTKFQLPTATIRSFPKQGAKGKNRPKYRIERPQAESDRNAVIVNYNNTLSPEGYSYSYDTLNSIHANETATTINGVSAKGFYSYTGDDGNVYTVTYTADENGFRPQGDHLPTPPPVPEAIKKVIEQAERNRAAGIIDDGSYDERKYGYLNYENGVNKYLPIKKSERTTSKVNKSKKPSNNPITDKNSSTNLSSTRNRNKLVELPSNTNSRSGLNNGQERGQNKFQNRQPITSVNDDQVAAKKGSNNQSIYLPNTSNPNKVRTMPQTVSQFGRKLNFNDSGYYYVPPVNIFIPNVENPSTRKSSYVTTVDPTPYNKIKMRNGFDITKEEENKNNKVNSTPSSKINNRDGTTTRKPYISGPEFQENLSEPNSQSDSSIENVNANEFPTFPFDQPSSQYFLNTTPMTIQKIDTNLPKVVDFQYYQSTTSPALFDQTLPSTVENRVNVPSGKPGITVSQDFTTTIRPDTFRNGVLEVKQNVKIFGIGTPEKTGTLSEGNFGYDNEVMYPTSTPNAETSVTGASGTIFPGPVLNNEVFQEIPNPKHYYGNEYFKTGESNTRNGAEPQTYYDTSNGQNLNPTQEIETQGYRSKVPEIPFFISPLETDGQGLLNFAGENQNPISNNPFGEDFSGPNQDQKFDPVNGYYYK